MIAIRHNGAEYRVGITNRVIIVWARPGRHWHTASFSAEQSALHFLSDHSLRKSKAKQLLAAAMRNEGPMADPEHRLRIREKTLADVA